MDLSLPRDLEDLVAQKLASGDYSTTAELFREALGLLVVRDRTREERLSELRREIEIGVQQADRGLTRPLDIEATLAEARRRRNAKSE